MVMMIVMMVALVVVVMLVKRKKIILQVQLPLAMMKGTIVTKENCICCGGVEGVLANTQSVFFYHNKNASSRIRSARLKSSLS